jgi:hypothetical protein
MSTYDSNISADQCAAGSIPYKEAGAALRLVLSRAARLGLNGTQWRVLGAVIDRTLSYSKYYDRTSSGQIAAFADLGSSESAQKRARKTLKNLSDQELIFYQPATRHNAWTLVGIPGGTGNPLAAESTEEVR